MASFGNLLFQRYLAEQGNKLKVEKGLSGISSAKYSSGAIHGNEAEVERIGFLAWGIFWK
jgi:hypothetical protein